MSTSLLSKVVLRFAHDKLKGNDEAVSPPQYMVLLEEHQKESLKFRLFLYAVKKFGKSPLTDEDVHTIN